MSALSLGSWVHVFDSVPKTFPDTADFLLVYMDGEWENLQWAQKNRPHARLIQITTKGAPGVRCCDIEAGDMGAVSGSTLAEKGAQWIATELEAGRHPWPYCTDSTRTEVEQAATVAQLDLTGAEWWEANWDGIPTTRPGWSAHQYVSLPQYDVSIALLSSALLADS